MNTNAITLIEPRTLAIPSETTVNSLMLIAKTAIRSGLAKTKNEADAFFIIMYGMELGIAPMTALRTIYSVQGGAPTCSGELMLALIRRSGKAQTIRISSTEETLKQGFATVYSKRADSGDEFTAKWGRDDDTRAGLKSNRDKYPAQMWTWRAVSIMNKALYSDVNAGLYAVEEIYPNTVLDENGEPVGEIVAGEFKVEPRKAPEPPAAQIIATVEPPVVTSSPAPANPYAAATGKASKWEQGEVNWFMANAVPLYDNPNHAGNSIEKMKREGLFNGKSPAEALDIVRKHVEESKEGVGA